MIQDHMATYTKSSWQREQIRAKGDPCKLVKRKQKNKRNQD